MDHNELMEQAARELAAVLERIDAPGACLVCLAGLSRTVPDGVVTATQRSP